MDTSGSPAPAVDAAQSAADLRRATVLSRDAQRAARWYVRYLVAFGAASFLLSAAFVVLRGPVAAWVTTPLWVGFLTVLTIWSSRQRATLRGFTRLHLTTIAAWAVVWGIVVTVGERSFEGSAAWWVLGGFAVAVPPLVAAVLVHARTRS